MPTLTGIKSQKKQHNGNANSVCLKALYCLKELNAAAVSGDLYAMEKSEV